MAAYKNNHLPSLFSPSIYFLFIAFFVLGGMAASAYLSLSHYRNFTDIGYQSFCAISRSLNCDTVSQSPYAIFLNVPVAVWGGLGYAFFFALLMLFKPKGKKFIGLSILCVLAGLFSLLSIVLALVSYFFVHSYCLMCIVTYAINLLLLLLTWMAQERFGFGKFISNLKMDVAFLYEKRARTFFIGILFISLSLTAVFFFPRYWLFPAFPKDLNVEYGVTDDGSPWIGARDPVLTIVEFTDYMCFQCGKMHSHLRMLLSEYPDKIRLVHRHFPLDPMVNPIVKETVHQNSGLVSLLAIYAHGQGKFWQVNDILFREARKKKSINFGVVSQKTGLDLSDFQEMLNNKKLITKLEKDIRAGVELGITATPGYLIDGQLYTGAIPDNIFSPILKGN